MSVWESMSVTELKQELARLGLPVSGKKSELISRLTDSEAEKIIFDAEIIEESQENRQLNKLINKTKALPLPVLAVTGIMLLGTMGGAILYGDDFIDWIQGEPDYQLIDFDSTSARGYAQSLVDMGHPEWEGRMSGTTEEHNTAEFIKSNFTTMGIPSTLEDFDVPMFVIDNEPELEICHPGDVGETFPAIACGPTDINAEFIEFNHRTDFVLQGYSGSAFIRFVDDIDLIDLGNGNESADWTSAASSVALIHMTNETESNTALFTRASENDVSGLILVNERQNCDELVSGDCVPYFKSVDISSIANVPVDLGFIMVSKNVGQTLIDNLINQDGRLQFLTYVENSGEATIKVPCGIIEGETDSLIVIGAHHDTVYMGPGAVDDTSGTATVLEIARQFGLIESQLGKPKHTIYFCTWGGEEEGLYGSTNWVDKHRKNLFENLRLYINLDMNHVDAERNSGVTLFGNSAKDVEHIQGISSKFKKEHPELADKYSINVRKMADTEMPYNSDHAPFVYNIDEDESDGKTYGKAVVCYGSGSSEYHTYLDNMDRFNEESLAVSGIIYGSLIYYLSYGD
ncbi:MAG TPA: M20/M25/M40 family metallo-hydrolase [Candidatus Thalassarchaeaceae archaeon]|nr:M20/M25/M40 family metallo-hydrolase [Candidatus Thalassarchaeaceae archaeon]MDP7658849.1 M20/M25/M40 family metallo-hydrolase [Candidatus Thalassarchaeaceae archaeon]HJL64412.1 M20/M25/M40 family metallo-hydrolase [Candidatus Thalassarchaeaceae archaeon]